MSRNLKRVLLSFSWPLKTVWNGYLNPYYDQSSKCPDCKNGYDRVGGRPDANAALFSDQWYGNAPFDPIAYGAAPLTVDHPSVVAHARWNVERSPEFYIRPIHEFVQDNRTSAERAIADEAQRLWELWRYQWSHHLIQADVDALVAEGRLMDFTRRPINDEQVELLKQQEVAGGSGYWLDTPNGRHPTAAEVNAWSIGGMGHDAINQHACVKARCLRENVPLECTRCKGSGTIWPSPEVEQLCDEWRKTDPPTGEGYQLWEDCSEGSPVSPVFASLEALCAWAEENATTFGSFKATAEEWRAMLDGGLVHAKQGNSIFL